jgi:hypothetical protein
MKGDFSRRTYDRGKYYRVVLMQQGRVVLDADGNEHNDVVARSAHAAVPPPDAKLLGEASKR